jgi:fused signal recognition particle receptor
VGACDTFRAAASDQLFTWAEKAGVEIVKSQTNADPAAVAFDTLAKARASGVDIVLLDTAGRLQNKTPLMKELEKIVSVLKKFNSSAPHEALLCIDSHTGQNAIDQARGFSSYVPLTGIVLTKLDSSCKGGIVVAITQEMQIPVKLIGVGEKIEDLKPFEPTFFLDTIFS